MGQVFIWCRIFCQVIKVRKISDFGLKQGETFRKRCIHPDPIFSGVPPQVTVWAVRNTTATCLLSIVHVGIRLFAISEINNSVQLSGTVFIGSTQAYLVSFFSQCPYKKILIVNDLQTIAAVKIMSSQLLMNSKLLCVIVSFFVFTSRFAYYPLLYETQQCSVGKLIAIISPKLQTGKALGKQIRKTVC